jgi:hypothetical protein
MKNRYILFPLIVSFVLLTLMSACGPKKGSITAAREAYLKKEYFVSGTNYRKVYSNTKNKQEKIESANKAAECYWLMNDMKNAESWYRKAIKVDETNCGWPKH